MKRTRRGLLGASLAGVAGCLGRLGETIPDEQSDDAATLESASFSGTARIGLVGDLQLGRHVSEDHADRGPEAVWGSMLERLQSLDGLFANLECVISDRGEPWPEKSYHFRADPDWAPEALQSAGMSAVTLANNHALDFQEAALLDTLDHLGDVSIASTGAGSDRWAALEPAVVDVGGLTVGMVGFVDHWGSFAAGADSPGTAYIEMDRQEESTRALVTDALDGLDAREPDLTIALLHWGPNWELRKSGTRRRFARWLIDRGIDVVHGHSAHVIQGVEVYQGCPIIYDAGDFVDDYYGGADGFRSDRTFLFELLVDGELETLRLVPAEIRTHSVHHARPEARAWLFGMMRGLSAEFGTSFLESEDGDALLVELEDA